MKTKLIVAFISVVVIVVTGWNFIKSKDQSGLSELVLANIEALAQSSEGGETGGEKKYQYVIMDIPPQKCYGYINGTLVEGLKIVCLSGSKYSVCASCSF